MKIIIINLACVAALFFSLPVYSKEFIGLAKNKSKLDNLNLCMDGELAYSKIFHDALEPWREAWIANDRERFSGLLAKNSNLIFLEKASSPFRVEDGIEEYVANVPVKEWREFLGKFQKVSDLELVVEKITPIKAAFKAGAKPKYNLSIRYDLRALMPSNFRGQLTGFWDVTVGIENGVYKINSVNPRKGTVVLAQRDPSFEDITVKSGLSNIPIQTRGEAIRRGGYSLSVGDLSGNGAFDIFVGSSVKSTYWKLEPGEKFSKVNSSITEPTLVKASVFADFNNSGRQDVLMTRFTPEKSESDVVFFKNLGNGQYQEDKNFVLNRWQANYSMPAAAADFNGDGLLDFYIGFPGRKDFTNFLDSANFSKADIPRQGIFLNSTGYKFKDNSKDSGLERLTLNNDSDFYTFAHSAMAVDVDNDGKSDLIVIDDRGNLSPVYKNLGDGKFDEVSMNLNLDSESLGMSVAVADTQKSTSLDVVKTSVNFHAANRIVNSCSGAPPDRLAKLKLATNGLSFYRVKKDGKYEDKTEAAGLDFVGEGAAGVEFIDYNNDGYPDLFVSNGLWSGNKRGNDISPELMFQMMTSPANINNINGLPNPNSGEVKDFLKTLKNYRGDYALGKEGKNDNTLSMAGFQHKRLFRNNKDGTFTEVGFLEGVDSIADGYIVARGDIDRDGRTDLILRNADPGTLAYTFPVLEVFKNRNKNVNSLTLQLKGSSESGSSSDAIGASVLVTANGKTEMQKLIANNGTAQSEKTLHFGLGKSQFAEKVEVTFPSGNIQTYSNVPAGRKIIIEEKRMKFGSL